MEDENGGLSISEKIFLPLGGVVKKPASMNDEEWEVLDKKELETIWLLVASIAFNISKEKKTIDPMKELDNCTKNPQPQIRYFL